jgi:hypothetical protein
LTVTATALRLKLGESDHSTSVKYIIE